MKPSKIVKEELYGPSGIKILGIVIGSMIGVLGMLAIVVWLSILLKSFVLGLIAFLIGTIVFCKLLNDVYYLIYPEKKPESAMDLAKRYEEMERNRIEYEETKKREKERDRSRDIGDSGPKGGRVVGDPMHKLK